MKLRIADKLALPADAVTSTIVVYGGKGMGKTNCASVLVEELAATRQRFAVIDPMGVWWGLRHAADGKGLGIKVLILGGIHGDLPITPESGVIVADLVVDEDANVIIDISRRADGSMWAIAERIRFVRDYAKRIYQRQGEKRRPLHQVIDEAARFAPQVVRQGENEVAACMGAIAVLVEEGRNVGLGVTLVTQRSARLNKDVAELADCMMAFRIVGPNSMRAVLDWLGEHVEKSRFKEISEKLRSLPRGSALVVSPGWLEFEGIAAIRMRSTFDSSATPKAGSSTVRGAGAKIDLDKYRDKLGKIVEEQKANDPKELKRKIAELTKERDQLARAKQAPTPAPGKTVMVEKSVIKDAQLARIEKMMGRAEKQADRFDAILEGELSKLDTSVMGVRQELAELRDQLATIKAPVLTPSPHNTIRSLARAADTLGGRLDIKLEPPNRVVRGPQLKLPAVNGHGDTKLPIGEAKTLTALIQYPNGLRRTQLTVLTGYARSSRDAYISRLKARGFVHDGGYGVIVTDAGRRALPDAGPLPSGPELRAWWERELPEGERRVLAVLCEQYPNRVMRTAIDEITKYQRSSRDAYLSRLKAKELIEDVGRGEVKASDTLFEVA